MWGVLLIHVSPMNEIISNFFQDIDEFIGQQFKQTNFEIIVVGYTALTIAEPKIERQTKDIDALKTDFLSSVVNEPILKALESEFGKKSPGLYRHGMYLDFVPRQIVWLPPKPACLSVVKLKHLDVLRLNPVDVCVSKAFAYAKSVVIRPNDRNDIMNALKFRLFTFKEFVKRIDETLPFYEMDAKAPDVFPKLIKFMNEVLAPQFDGSVSLKYEIPSWMENM